MARPALVTSPVESRALRSKSRLLAVSQAAGGGASIHESIEGSFTPQTARSRTSEERSETRISGGANATIDLKVPRL